jgi:hypothetical protein
MGARDWVDASGSRRARVCVLMTGLADPVRDKLVHGWLKSGLAPGG